MTACVLVPRVQAISSPETRTTHGERPRDIVSAKFQAIENSMSTGQWSVFWHRVSQGLGKVSWQTQSIC